MSNQLWFTTDLFSPLPGEEGRTNPGRYGEALARWLCERLSERGHAADAPEPQDWGWMLKVRLSSCALRIGCANEDGGAARWGLFVESETGILRRLFRGADCSAAVAALERELEDILRVEPRIADIAWENARAR